MLGSEYYYKQSASRTADEQLSKIINANCQLRIPLAIAPVKRL